MKSTGNIEVPSRDFNAVVSSDNLSFSCVDAGVFVVIADTVANGSSRGASVGLATVSSRLVDCRLTNGCKRDGVGLSFSSKDGGSRQVDERVVVFSISGTGGESSSSKDGGSRPRPRFPPCVPDEGALLRGEEERDEDGVGRMTEGSLGSRAEEGVLLEVGEGAGVVLGVREVRVEGRKRGRLRDFPMMENGAKKVRNNLLLHSLSAD